MKLFLEQFIDSHKKHILMTLPPEITIKMAMLD